VNCLNSIETSYRTELRDLFAAHFGRFEEKLERRLAETRTELIRELIKWVSVFWVPVVVALIGLYLKV
jgi:hypothetical protein